MSPISRIVGFLCALALLSGVPTGQAAAQATPIPGVIVGGVAQNRSTVNGSVTITTGGTFQTALSSIIGTSTPPRQSLTIQNNNTSTDNCWVFIGGGTASEAKAIILGAGGSYQRYFPFVPSDAIQVTCASTSDTMYIDTQ